MVTPEENVKCKVWYDNMENSQYVEMMYGTNMRDAELMGLEAEIRWLRDGAEFERLTAVIYKLRKQINDLRSERDGKKKKKWYSLW